MSYAGLWEEWEKVDAQISAQVCKQGENICRKLADHRWAAASAASGNKVRKGFHRQRLGEEGRMEGLSLQRRNREHRGVVGLEEYQGGGQKRGISGGTCSGKN